MKTNFLFPYKYKNVGWLVLIPSVIIGMITLITSYEPNFLNFQVPALFIDAFFGERRFFGIVKNNVLNEILGILIILSALLVAFSKEKVEDEFISKIRLESLVWAVYINYGVLLLAFIFIFDLAFLWVMVFNMFTILFFFIIRFNWQLSKFNKSATYEE